MEIEAFGFEFGKKQQTKAEKQEQALQKFTAPEVFDGTVTVEAGGYFSSAIDYTGTLKRSSNTRINKSKDLQRIWKNNSTFRF